MASSNCNRNNNNNNYYHESHSFTSPPSSSIFSTHEKEGLYKAIFSRRDVRSHFITDKPIPDDVLFRILNAAHHAPSVGYSQPWNFIVIKDRSLRRQVKESYGSTESQSLCLKIVMMRIMTKNRRKKSTCH